MNNSCPACFNSIPEDRLVSGTAYCSCGHTFSYRETSGKDHGVAVKLVILTILLAAVIIHIFNWDTFSVAIVTPKVKQMLGVATVADLNLVADICEKRKKENCQIHALLKSYDQDHAQTKHLVRVGQILIEKKRYQEAVRVYATYFRTPNSNDQEARYNFALALTETGDYDSAKQEFAYLIKINRHSPKFNVARSYVELLMKTNDLNTARQIIAEYRQTGPSATMFLEKEWRHINAITALDTRPRLPASVNRASINE